MSLLADLDRECWDCGGDVTGRALFVPACFCGHGFAAHLFTRDNFLKRRHHDECMARVHERIDREQAAKREQAR